MTNRQVRLDPDTEQLVEQVAYREGCSLTAAANRIIRASPAVTADPIAGQASVSASLGRVGRAGSRSR